MPALSKIRRKIEVAFDFVPWKINHAQNLKQFHDRHKSKSCIIVGNGPSLNKMDLSPIKNCFTFGLNKIYLILKTIDLNLNYLVSVNKLVIEQSLKEFNDFQCPVFLSYSAAKGLPLVSSNIFFLHTGNFFGFYEDIGMPVYEGYTVTYVAMQIAYFMGFQNVYLIGVDHNFMQKGNPNEIQSLDGMDVNHFDPGYFAGQKWQLADLVNSEKSYFLAKQQYEKNDRKIYDATLDGKLTVFDKVDFQEAIKNCQM